MAEMASIPSGAPPIHGGGPAMGSRLHGNDGRRRARRTPHSRDGGNPRGGGRRSTGTTGRRRTPQSSFPQQRGNPRGGAGDGFPSPRERRAGGGAPHNRHSHNSGNPRQPHRHSRDGGNPRRGAGDGFPSPRERRAGGGAPHNRHSRNSGNPRRGATSSFPRRRSFPRRLRESTAGGRRWVPVSTGTTPAAAHPTIVIPGGHPTSSSSFSTGTTGRRRRRESTAGIHGGGAAMGSRLHGNDGPAAAHPTIVIPTTAGIHGPTSSFPRRRESTGGGRRWVPVSTGTTGRRRTPQSSFPRRRESTAGGRRWVPVSTGTTGRRRAHPTIVIPATAGIHGGGPAMGSRLHGNDGPAGAPHNRHSRDGGNPRGGAGDGFPSPRERRAGGAPHNRHSRDGGVAVTLEPVLHPRLSR